MSPTSPYMEPQPDRSGLKTALVAGALIALVAANVYLYVQLDHVRTDLAKTRESMTTELANLRDASSVTTASQTRHLDTLKEELENARNQARSGSAPTGYNFHGGDSPKWHTNYHRFLTTMRRSSLSSMRRP